MGAFGQLERDLLFPSNYRHLQYLNRVRRNTNWSQVLANLRNLWSQPLALYKLISIPTSSPMQALLFSALWLALQRFWKKHYTVIVLM